MKLISIFILFFLLLSKTVNAADTIDVNLNVEGCNNNSYCEAVIGEDVTTCPNDCTVSSGGGTSGSIPTGNYLASNYFQNVTVSVNADKALITWSSWEPTLATLRWGRSADFGDGTSASTVFVKEHMVEISNLIPGTYYYFTIEARNKFGFSVTMPYRTFYVQPLPDRMPAQNPRNVSAQQQGDVVVLRWTNPPNDDFAHVRIMRNEGGYRSSPFIGTLIYEGRGERTIDGNVLFSKEYFYTIFSKDENGNYSSGSGARITLQQSTPPVEKPEPPVIEPPVSVPTTPTIPFTMFTVSQDDDVEVEIYATLIPKGVSDLWISVTESGGGEKLGDYLFTYDVEGLKYKANIPPLIVGQYDVVVHGTYEGNPVVISIGVMDIKTSPRQIGQTKPGSSLDTLLSVGIPILILLLLLLLRRLFARRS